MKRNFNGSDCLTHFLSQPVEEEMNTEEDCIHNREFESMAGAGDGEDYGGEETGQMGGDKKRRLSNHQVKSLEKIFEVDNKLDPDRKVKVAEDLGLQPRQVAIWFQNRRARCKTKQLERDYNLLKSNYEALKQNYHKLEQEKEIIIKELIFLKAKFHEDIKEENYEYDNEKTFFLQSHPLNANQEAYTSSNREETHKLTDIKDGFSDSDSSGVLTEENVNLNICHLQNISSFGMSSMCSSSNTTLNQIQFADPEVVVNKGCQQQSLRMDESYLVNNSEDESCNIYLVDQAPNLCWYFHDQRI